MPPWGITFLAMSESTRNQAQDQDDGGYLPALRFKALTPLFDSVVRTTTRESTFKEALLRGADLRPGDHVLDLGCGTGTLAIAVKALQPESSVIGLDADPDILELAREKAGEASADVEFDRALATDLPYPDGSFDHVMSTLFFHHLLPEDKRATLREVVRILRPGGRLHVADYTRGADPLQQALSWQVRLFDGISRTGENFTGRLPALVAAAGFSDPFEETRLRTLFGTLSLFRATR